MKILFPPEIWNCLEELGFVRSPQFLDEVSYDIWEKLEERGLTQCPDSSIASSFSKKFVQSREGSIHTPLSFACSHNAIQLTKSLLFHGADPLGHYSPTYFSEDDTVLHAAMLDGSPELFEVLFEAGVPFSPLYGNNGYEGPISLGINNAGK